MTWKDMERQTLADALKHFNGNRVEVAKALGLSWFTVKNRIAWFPEIAHLVRDYGWGGARRGAGAKKARAA